MKQMFHRIILGIQFRILQNCNQNYKTWITTHKVNNMWELRHHLFTNNGGNIRSYQGKQLEGLQFLASGLSFQVEIH